MNKIKPIEDCFKDLCSETKPALFTTYEFAKQRLESSYYPYICSSIPHMTDHSQGHVSRIFEKLSGFLAPHMPCEGNLTDRIIDVPNLNLLLNSVIWHDIGNLFGRNDHTHNIHNVFDECKTIIYESPMQEWIPKVAKGHSGNDSINLHIERRTAFVDNFTIHPKYLSALLRISDELDEDYRRAEERVFSTVPVENHAYWRFCHCNRSIMPVYSNDSTGNYSLNIVVEGRFHKDNLFESWGKGKNNEVPAIIEYINRICKINKERIYCNNFLQGAFYTRTIDGIKLNLSIYDDHDAVIDTIEYYFDDSSTIDKFFLDGSVVSKIQSCSGVQLWI